MEDLEKRLQAARQRAQDTEDAYNIAQQEWYVASNKLKVGARQLPSRSQAAAAVFRLSYPLYALPCISPTVLVLACITSCFSLWSNSKSAAVQLLLASQLVAGQDTSFYQLGQRPGQGPSVLTLSCRRRRNWVPRSRRLSRWPRQTSATSSAEPSRRLRLPSKCCFDCWPFWAMASRSHGDPGLGLGVAVTGGQSHSCQAAWAGLLTGESWAARVEHLTAAWRVAVTVK